MIGSDGGQENSQSLLDSVVSQLSGRPLPSGLYINQHRTAAPSILLEKFKPRLVPYILLLHDINVLVHEWNDIYRSAVEEKIKATDYEWLVGAIMHRRSERDCKKCKSRSTARQWSRPCSHDPSLKIEEYKCDTCNHVFRIVVNRQRNRPCKEELRRID